MRIVQSAAVLVLTMAAMSLVVPDKSGAQSFVIQELGVADAIKAVGPNRNGQIAVRAGFVAASSRRVSSGRSPEALGSLSDGDYTTANGINDRGDVVGSANLSFGSKPCRPEIAELVDDHPDIKEPFPVPPAGNCPTAAVRAVIWTANGGLNDLGTLPGGTASEAFGINNAGAIVGFSNTPDGIRAFVRQQNGAMQALPPLPGGAFSKAFGINEAGVIVGSSGSPAGTRASQWSLGRVQELGALPGDTFSEATTINNSGAVAGNSSGARGMQAFLWTAGNGMQRLPPLPGGLFSAANAINDAGTVVGTAGTPLGERAVRWDSIGQPKDLNAEVSLPAGLVLTTAMGINVRGEIIALGKEQGEIHQNHEGPSRVFLLTPRGQ